MNLLMVLLTIVIVGLVVWLINKYIPMTPIFKKILNYTAAIAMIIWLLKIFGILAPMLRLFNIDI